MKQHHPQQTPMPLHRTGQILKIDSMTGAPAMLPEWQLVAEPASTNVCQPFHGATTECPCLPAEPSGKTPPRWATQGALAALEVVIYCQKIYTLWFLSWKTCHQDMPKKETVTPSPVKHVRMDRGFSRAKNASPTVSFSANSHPWQVQSVLTSLLRCISVFVFAGTLCF